MPLSLDQAFRQIGIAKGDLPASTSERKRAQAWYRDFVTQLTQQLRAQTSGDLSITRESIRITIEGAYCEYRSRKGRTAIWRLLQDEV